MRALRRPLRPLRRAARRVAEELRAATYRRRIRVARDGGVAVAYGREVPKPSEPAHGGTVKLQALAEVWPPARSFSVLYLVSSALPPRADRLLEVARERGGAVVWNQDGVAYVGWHGPGWEQVNERLARGLDAADHVFFQSSFCRLASDRFLGPRDGPAEVLPNPVDTRRFVVPDRRDERPTLLLGGNQYQRYRFETAVKTLELLPSEWRLLVTGRLSWDPDPARVRQEARSFLDGRRLDGRLELAGSYTQAEAPALLGRAHVLLHTKYNDPCPGVVLEALACGLPVVYSASGGTPELVGDAGVGVEAPLDWERDHPPDPHELAAAVLACSERLPELSAAARTRAERFDVRPWVERHRAVFEALVQ
jgi:glycosyltransferase involved in cell wall biosynthesis